MDRCNMSFFFFKIRENLEYLVWRITYKAKDRNGIKANKNGDGSNQMVV